MLTNDDLPDPWDLDRDVIEDSAALDAQLGLAASDAGPMPSAFSWSALRNRATGERALVRMQRPGSRPGAFVSGLVLLPASTNDRLTSADLRDFPLASVEASADARQYESASLVRIALELGPDIDALAPLGAPRSTERFYERVALQFAQLRGSGEHNVAKRMAEINGKPISTVHNWLAETRRRGHLAAGKRGRAR